MGERRGPHEMHIYAGTKTAMRTHSPILSIRIRKTFKFRSLLTRKCVINFLQDGGNVKDVFARWARAINQVDADMIHCNFFFHFLDHLITTTNHTHHLLFCPTTVWYYMQVEGTLKSAGYGYAYNDHLGYITTCPSNVGTGLRASVMLKLPKLYKVNRKIIRQNM